MAKRYGAFVVRCWWLASRITRVEIEHVQSGDRVRVDSLAAALAWLEERGPWQAARPPPPPRDGARESQPTRPRGAGGGGAGDEQKGGLR